MTDEMERLWLQIMDLEAEVEQRDAKIERLRAMYEEAYQSAQAQAALVRSSETRAEELEEEIERLRKIILNLAHGFSHGEFEV